MYDRYYHLARGRTYRLLGPATVQPGRTFVEGETLRIGRRGALGDVEAISPDVGYAPQWLPITIARLQAARGVFPGDRLAFYQDENGGYFWVRPWDEFHDGRFERLAPAKPTPSSPAVEAVGGWLGRIADLERQRDDLQAANNRYLKRARDAEAERDRLRASAQALAAAMIERAA